jgi:hypothetical protein
VLIGILVVAGYIGMEVKLITVSGYNVFLNELILGLSTGFVVGFIIQARLKFKTH